MITDEFSTAKPFVEPSKSAYETKIILLNIASKRSGVRVFTKKAVSTIAAPAQEKIKSQ